MEPSKPGVSSGSITTPLHLLLAAHPESDSDALEHCLHQAGLKVRLSRCDRPAKLAEQLEGAAVDLVLLHARFAGRETLAEVSDLLRQPLNQRPPVLLLTHARDLAGARQAISLGAQGFVASDLMSPATLRASIDVALAQSTQAHVAAGQQRALWRQSMQDGLTGLANRQLLQDRLGQELRLAQRSDRTFAVVTLDLDRFSLINDSCGQLAGDQVLREVASRLTESLRRSDTLARLGGDQFCALLPAIGGPLHATRLAEKLRRSLLRPYQVDGYLADPGVSLGIALHPQHGDSVSNILRRSELAMFAAKRRGGGIVIYADREPVSRPDPADVERALAQALRGGSLAPEIWVRPQLCLDSGSCVGAEAFVRWRQPGFSVMHPQELFRTAEKAELIRPLTELMFDRTLAYLARRETPGPALTLSPPPQLLAEPELVDVIAARLAASGIDRSELLLDFDEASAIAHGGAANPVLRRLVGLGLKISVSGIGGALSSLKFLRDFPLAELRIHRDFVSRMVQQRPDARLCGALIHLAECLDIRAVACGITDAKTSRRLQELGCRFGVGPAISREMALEDFDTWRTELQVLPLARRFRRCGAEIARNSGSKVG
ncbi:MAG: EAL domain-containing protein [Pseudomonadota bacterium]